ncbi:hypothetical protein Sango_3074900 [Sesamum angolense]|uniref:Reverse transcriptase domain-containing protein n=1 Tax=Sesamum angolense TaxID=2727404 RepID=A0AAE1T954_9LAMI|nr:hypothetical protein Sango_3074900 [Sesamum angolense]
MDSHGDFNAVLDDSEVSGYAADTSASMAEFLECITESELTHLPFTGANFTWHNCSDGERSLWKRLDRMLVNEAWLVKWPQSKYICTHPRTSDHSPLILQDQDSRQNSSIFRIENYMAKMVGFQRIVEEHWRHQFTGTDMYILTRKLKSLKPIFRSLKKTHGDLYHNVEQAAHFLKKAQLLSQEFKHESILLQLEKCCRMIFCEATTMEVNMLKQRAKLSWLKGGDNCSKFFFRKISARRAHQRVYQIQNDDGHILTDNTAVTGEFVNYFKKLFGGSCRQPKNLEHLQPFAKYIISEEEATQITAPVQRHEIKEALFDINEDSAPGPDGFSSCFFKATWAAVGEDVCHAVMEFFNHGRLLKQLNATLITLIPKVQLPTKVGDFRPISCCNVIYKIITKVMVKRMQIILEKLIDNCQNAFVPGRSISDNVLIAQELLSGYNQKKLPPRCTIKVDLQKAYDMVDWDYLLAVLLLFKFPNRFIVWVEQCITTTSFSISLNGAIHGFFTSTRGLRQGDPVSPYLFVLVMESLHLLIKSTIQNDNNFQFHWRCKELGIVNHCFADDLLLFCKADIHSATVLHGILQEFQGLAGLYANAQKSQILLSKSSIQVQLRFRVSLDFHKARIAGWNQLKLTYAGRTQLIKSVLSSFHQYWCSVFILPKGVIKTIEAKLRNFLWKGGTESGGYKIAWEQVCKPTSHGGLGIRNIQTMNNALMGKHLWQILTKKHDSLWVSWISRYRLRHGTLWAANDKEGSWIWKKLLKLRRQLIKGIQFRVGDGTEFKLWLDPWHPDGALIHRCPHGPLVTGLPLDSPLSTVIVEGNWNWPSAYHIDINEIINNLPAIHNGANDTIIWNSNSGKYFVKDAYELFSELSNSVEWASLLHGPFHTPRHKFILWLAILEHLSTLDKPWCNPKSRLCTVQ